MPKYKIKYQGKTISLNSEKELGDNDILEIAKYSLTDEPQINPVPSKQESNFIPEDEVFAQPYQSGAKKLLGENADYIKPVTKILDFVASPVINAGRSAGRNISRGVENIGEGNVGTGALQLATAPIELGAGAFGATPAGVAFNIGVGSAQEIPYVKDAVESVLSPTQRMFKPESELGQAATGLADAGVNLALLHKAGQAGEVLKQKYSPETMIKTEPKLIPEKINEGVLPQERLAQTKTVKEFATEAEAKAYAKETNGAFTDNGNKFIAGSIDELTNVFKKPKKTDTNITENTRRFPTHYSCSIFANTNRNI